MAIDLVNVPKWIQNRLPSIDAMGIRSVANWVADSFAGIASGTLPVDGLPTAKSAGAVANGTADDVAALATRFAAGSTTVLTPGTYSASSLTVPYGKTLVIQRGAQLQISGTTISIQGQVRAPDAVFGPPGLCASIGDSRASASAYAIPGTSLTTLNTLWTMCMLRTKGALQWTPELSFAIGGSTTTSLYAQITSLAAAARLPRYCYILSGTNDDSGVSADEQVRRFVNAWLRLLGMGIVPIHICDLPRVQSSYTAALCSRNRQCQARLATLARHMGVIFIDGTTVMTDYSNTTGDPLAASFSTDLIHQSPVGNYAIAGVLADLLLGKMMVPAWGHLASPTGADVYHATNNPYGNNWTNPLFIGTGGAKGTGVTGNVPTGYTCTRNTGADSAVCDVEARTDGVAGNWWKTTVSVTAALNEFIINQATFAGVAGQTVVFAADVYCTGMTLLASATIELNQTGVGSSTAWKGGDNASSAATSGDTPATYAGRLAIGPFVLQEGCTSVRARLTAKFPTGSAGVVRFGNPYYAILR